VIAAVKRRLNQDVLAGLMFISFGAAALILGRNLQVGSASDMGAGYFPLVLGLLLVAVGLAITLLGLWRGGAAFEIWSMRASIFVCAAFIVFAIVIEWAGLLLTAAACTMLAAMGTVRFHLLRHAVLAIAASLLAVGVFIWALKIPIPLLPQI
jgi:hypothetical protein